MRDTSFPAQNVKPKLINLNICAERLMVSRESELGIGKSEERGCKRVDDGDGIMKGTGRG